MQRQETENKEFDALPADPHMADFTLTSKGFRHILSQIQKYG